MTIRRFATRQRCNLCGKEYEGVFRHHQVHKTEDDSSVAGYLWALSSSSAADKLANFESFVSKSMSGSYQLAAAIRTTVLSYVDEVAVHADGFGRTGTPVLQQG